jgi:hypothetical protein
MDLNDRGFKTGSKDHICFTRHQGSDNRRDIVHRIFEISVLYSDNIAGRELNPLPNGRALTLIDLLEMELNRGRECEILKDRSALISRAVIDNDELLFNTLKGERVNLTQKLSKVSCFIVYGNNERHLHHFSIPGSG